MTVATLRRIGALIRDQRDVLISRWRRQVRQLPSAAGLDTPTLNDHMPLLLDELADALESQPDTSAEDALLQGSPPAHGRQRLHDGFNVEEVVAEYNVIRACIHDVAEEHGMVIHGNDLRVVNRMIDEAIGLAVQTYATQLSLEIKQHRDQHLAFVANDLRTPLKAISITVGVIERTLVGASFSEQSDKLLKILRRNIQQLEQSVIDVIKSSTDSPAAAAAEKLERRTIDLWPLVESVISDLEPIITASGVELVNEVSSDLRVFADASLTSRIFENVLSFAINEAPRGKVEVQAMDTGRDGIRCAVHHNGNVIPAETLSTLFQSQVGEPAEDGIGLGLQIVRQFIETHGGTISASSNEADGTTIEFRIPAAKQSN